MGVHSVFDFLLQLLSRCNGTAVRKNIDPYLLVADFLFFRAHFRWVYSCHSKFLPMSNQGKNLE